jgi:D-tagatose-1,6-bisphosphate aldolase subunit GatZ/KbaZ
MAPLSAAPPLPLLEELVHEQKQGRARGVASLCSAHPEVLRAAFEAALADGSSVLVESTCNQVNQEGGYTGVKPAGFAAFVARLAREAGLPASRVVLGGDHLGPNPWTRLPASAAMERACELVRDCVRAGYAKIHLDASMPCADDPPGPLPDEVAAERTARLALAAETAAVTRTPGAPQPVYVIGTEVPPPGGQAAGHGGPVPTSVADARRGRSLTHAAFARLGLEHALRRILAQVVQPGVEFGDDEVFVYRREAAGLRALAEADEQLVFEAHSTDYQPESSLRALVEDHFAILKVGPELTFAWREALFALEAVERELLSRRAPERLSGLARTLDEAMRAEPRHWQAFHAGGDEDALRLRRAFSLSDRSRYYWAAPPVQAAVERLLANLDREPLPRGLLSQHRLAAPHDAPGELRPGRSAALARAQVRRVLARYARACEPSRPGPLAPEVLPL